MEVATTPSWSESAHSARAQPARPAPNTRDPTLGSLNTPRTHAPNQTLTPHNPVQDCTKHQMPCFALELELEAAQLEAAPAGGR